MRQVQRKAVSGRFVFLGPPGVGKGTQAELLAKDADIPHISTGVMLREEVSSGSALGKQVAPLLASGEFVPDSLVQRIIEQRLISNDARNGFILDGFPRNLPQAETLSVLLKLRGIFLDAVISFDLGKDELLSRLSARRESENRADDNLSIQARRLEVYQEQTEPLLDYYRDLGLLLTVPADGSVEEVYQCLSDALKGRLS